MLKRSKLKKIKANKTEEEKQRSKLKNIKTFETQKC